MMSIDYPHRNKLFKSSLDMIKNDGKWMFIRGITPFIFGVFLMSFSFYLA
jgi:hypothetical protein